MIEIVKFPDQIELLPEEQFNISRIRVAKYLGQIPSAIDAMPYTDFCQVLEIMRADNVLGNWDG